MERITVWKSDRFVAGDLEAAVQRLGKLEDLYERLTAEQQQLAGQMEALREQGREKSVKFRELLNNKMMNGALLIKLRNEMET